MSKAEQFIQDCTRNCSNEMESPLYANPKLNFYPWLTPDQARRAVEIAREEIYEWIRNNIKNYVYMDIDKLEGRIDVDEVINDLKQTMR